MGYSPELTKISDNNEIAFPIDPGANIGDSIVNINTNFEELDKYTCNFEFSALNFYNPLYNLFADNSAKWVDAIDTLHANKECWTDTYNTVHNLSGVWLKPISLIYPFPFSVTGTEQNIIAEITAWVNEALPIASDVCINFIVGQELFIFTPQYSEINKLYAQSKTTGVKTIVVHKEHTCIGCGTMKFDIPGSIDCGSTQFNATITDQFVSIFTGLKFIVNPDGTAWIYDSTLYN